MLEEQLNLQEIRPDVHPPSLGKTLIVKAEDNAGLLLKIKSVWQMAAGWGRFCDKDLGEFIEPDEAQKYLPSWLLESRIFNLETWLDDLHDREWIWWSSAMVGDYLKLDILAEAMPLSTWTLTVIIETCGAETLYDDLWIDSSQIEEKLRLKARKLKGRSFHLPFFRNVLRF